ncbi:uncharacterized protein LOC143281488 [Babylonia areolata]|uniref:uncharacterized protein LOC143281488 n=1 Tax=Babylonia areolata TaxID=304850 RepID=UPI003FD2E187
MVPAVGGGSGVKCSVVRWSVVHWYVVVSVVMSRRCSFLRRHRGWVVSGMAAVLVLAAVLDSQTRGYSHLRDILTSPVHYLQPLHLLSPEFSNVSHSVKYEGEDELLDIFTSRLSEFSRERTNLKARSCTDSGLKPDDACYDPTCNATFSASPRDRLRQVLATRRRIPPRYLQALASATRGVGGPHRYIFVTAVSSNHYYEVQGLVHSLRRNLFPRLSSDNFTFVLFDVGLTAFERHVTEKNCGCTVVDFPFSELPEFVRHLTCYSWKPIAIASLLPKAEYVVWTDASIRWESGCPVDELFERCRRRGFQCISDYGSIAVRTVQSAFDFHGDRQCQYSPFTEMLSGFEMFYNDRFTREAVMQPWLSCAYDQRCMCVRDHVWQFRCPSSPPRGYGRCHRYDQSGLGLIQSKLLLDQRPIIYVPPGCVRVAREVKMNWFEPRKTDVLALVVGLFVAANVVVVGGSLLAGWWWWWCGVDDVGRGGDGGGKGRVGLKSENGGVRWWWRVVGVVVVAVVLEGAVVVFLLWVFV